MLNKDSDASEPEEEAQEDIATVPTSADETPAQLVTDSVLLPTMMMIHQAMPFNHSCTQVRMG